MPTNTTDLGNNPSRLAPFSMKIIRYNGANIVFETKLDTPLFCILYEPALSKLKTGEGIWDMK